MLLAELLMKDRGLKQIDVAIRGGVNTVTVSRVLRGYEKPYPKIKQAFCKALEWDGNPDELFAPVSIERYLKGVEK